MLSFPSIDPVAFSLGPVKIHWYGLMYLVAFAGAWGLAYWRMKKYALPWTNEQISDLIFYAALGVILGGRIGYMLFYNTAELIQQPLSLFKIWQGGMSFHGGLLGVLLSLWLFSRQTGKQFLAVGDFVAPLVPLGSMSLPWRVYYYLLYSGAMPASHELVAEFQPYFLLVTPCAALAPNALGNPMYKWVTSR